jgi:hypothetical protein
VLASLIVLGAAMAALLQLMALAAQQRRGMNERRLALLEVANQAERIALLSWDETAPEKLTGWQPSDDLRVVLPAAQCRLAVTEEPGTPRGRRIRLEVGWTNSVQQPVEPVTLTVWRFAEEARP